MTSSDTPIRVVGIGGTLRESSTSLWALQYALDIVRESGATPNWLICDASRCLCSNPIGN